MSYTILLVDDDPDLLPSMVTALEELSDLHVLSAENGADGLAMVFEHQPDCIVIDVRMPELNGFQLVQALRGDPATASIPLIILSALTQEKHKYSGLAAGVDRYLTKPVDPLELIETISAVAQLGRLDRLAQMRMLLESEPPIA